MAVDGLVDFDERRWPLSFLWTRIKATIRCLKRGAGHRVGIERRAEGSCVGGGSRGSPDPGDDATHGAERRGFFNGHYGGLGATGRCWRF